jgi:hypothetical protein
MRPLYGPTEFADIRRAVKQHSCIGLPWKYVVLANEFELAQTMLKEIAPKHLYRPILYTVIYQQVAYIGLSNKQ